ncbi:hypothetical protein [Bacillus sp. NPDC094106]|uniref:hypothetical protein n=1 Tax=Bacillus sp. NPDC094106 TaxID=3363949 RepID=UPI00380C70D6
MKYIIKTRAERLKFKQTELYSKMNKLSLSIGLNSIWSLGNLMKLCKKSKANNFYEWESYYFASGKKRNGLIKRMTPEKQEFVKKYTLDEKESEELKNVLSYKERTVNFEHGRKLEEIFEMGELLYEEATRRGKKHVSINDYVNFIYISVIDVPWMGYSREINAISTLHERFNWLRFQRAHDSEDVEFAIDYKIFRADKLLGAIQIKSEKELLRSRKGKKFYSENVRRAKEKSKVYSDKKNVPVLFVYAGEHGKIANKNVIRQIYKLSA